MEQCYRHFDPRTARSSIGGGKSSSVSEKLADACGGVIPASVENSDAIAGVGNRIFREERRCFTPIACNAERNAIV